MTMFRDQSLLMFCSVTCVCLIADAFDCRKFVFAPRCRGVSAKRSGKLSSQDLRDLGEMEDTWVDWPRSSPEDISDTAAPNSRKKTTMLQKLLEKFNDYSLHEEDN